MLMRNKQILSIILVFVLLLIAIPSLTAEEQQYVMTGSREGNLRIGAEMFTIPLPVPSIIPELLQISPFGVTAMYGVTEQLDVKATIAPFTYILLEQFPDNFFYIAEGSGRYHFSPIDSSFFVEGHAAVVGAVIGGEPVDFIEELGTAVMLFGGGFGFTFQTGNADLSIGLNAYSLQLTGLGESFPFPLPIMKVAVTW
jgi:hypothetical protein